MASHYNSKTIARGMAFLIPAGTYHNIINTSNANRLQLIAVYSAAPHPVNTIHKTKQDAMKAEY
jgi:mannose-6-phosphate isomerase-like protein (cupin superfamily)